MLKFFEIDARFPRHAGAVPPTAVEYVARQLGLSAEDFAGYDFAGRSVKEHRRQIREALGFRVFSRGDEDKMIAWLAEEVCPSELNEDRQREAVLGRCRAEKLEPPGRMARIVGAANRIADERFCAVTESRLPAGVAAALRGIVAESGEADEPGDDDDPSFFTEMKADPGKLGLETLLGEITKLKRVRSIGLPAELFADVAEKRIARWRARAVAEYPSTLRRPSGRGEPDVAGGAVLVPADRGHRLPRRAVHRFGADHQYPRRAAGGQGADRRVPPGRGQGGRVVQAGRRVAAPPRRGGAAGGVPRGRGADPQGSGRRGQGDRVAAAGPGAHGAERLVLPPLPGDAAQAAGRAGVQVQQHRLPAGDGRRGAAAPLQGP